MTSPVFALYLTCLFLGKTAQTTALKFSSSVRQDSSFISANVGDSVSLRCSYKGDVAAKLYWYKQTLGQKPRIISTLYDYESNGTFYNEFSNNPRFTLDTENNKNHLRITDLHISDSATYYCVSSFLNKIEFLEGTTLSVKGSGNIQALVHQSASESIQPGGSVTLNCAVHTGTCDDGNHSVYWFKNSQESQPGIIYTHGGRNDQCERNNNTQTNTCVYNLPLKSLDLSHAGTYYCAVVSCGQILFGNGTKLDVGYSAVLVYFLSGALAFTTILSVLLAFSVCMMKRNSFQSAESQARISAPSTVNAKGYKDADNLYSAALSVNLINRRRRQKDQTWSECVYYSVK
ncbi:immunoglobulin kappa light chain-like isoform X1 [Thunnus thynnus]|uniref:immunoglobulin kappa light chain-like isoform X1 n=1 Tax=Thunnus thynnus TaxID=8237 RepID=UPI003528F2AA